MWRTFSISILSSSLFASLSLGQGGYIMGPSSGSGGAENVTQLFASTASATVANTGTETTIIGSGVGSLTLPVDFFTAGQVLSVHATGLYSTKAATAGTLNIRLKFGSTTIVATGDVTVTDNLTNEAWQFDVIVTCRTTGGSGTVIAESIFLPTVGTLVQNGWKMTNTSTVTVDTTATQAVQLTADWGTGDTGNTITGTNFVMGGSTPVPSQTGNGGKFLGTDGTSMAWDFPISTGADASVAAPATGNTGRAYLPNNGYYVRRSDGSSLNVPWGPIFPFTEPIDADYSWINQGGASTDTTRGGVYLNGPASASASVRARVKSAPATPYHIEIAFIPVLYPENSQFCGPLFRQSSDGKMVSILTIGNVNVNAPPIGAAIQRWNSATSASTVSATLPVQYMTGGVVWMRIGDDGANRTYDIGWDGYHWLQIYSEARTTFMTADQVGFFVDSENANHAAGMALLSWKETN